MPPDTIKGAFIIGKVSIAIVKNLPIHVREIFLNIRRCPGSTAMERNNVCTERSFR
jgi:hypothetical protein